MRIWRWAVFGLACVLALAGGWEAALGQRRLDRVVVGTVGHPSDAGMYIAMEKGYFAEEGIEVSMNNTFRTGGQTIPLLATGQLHVGGGALDPAFINAIHQGINLKVVAGKGIIRRGNGFNVLLVRRQLYEQGVRSIAGLRGRKLAVTNLEGAVTFEVQEMLRTAGLSLRDVDLVVLPNPEMPVALQNGAVDAAFVIEPVATVATYRLKSAVVLMTADRVVNDFPIGVIFYGPAILANPDLAVRWMTAYIRGLRYYDVAMRDPSVREEVIRIFLKYLPFKDVEVYRNMIWPGLRPDGTFNVSYIRPLQEFMLEWRAIRAIIPTEQLVDFSYLQKALDRIRERGSR
ncbi:MAG: ABC transporter substrate-binding protein [Armatimonadota bacterium]|nr:ABC transporter substrate-binding protein [Armatimonadota bacterium]MDR7570683.1 ABC transporter substrate-binding protein [Armatimonadota bacterium]MDR7615312.1 ABC transporter substrate-binding protein [Armatimonadota bacterium]